MTAAGRVFGARSDQPTLGKLAQHKMSAVLDSMESNVAKDRKTIQFFSGVRMTTRSIAFLSRFASVYGTSLLLILASSQSTSAPNSMSASNKFFMTEPQASLEAAIRVDDSAGIGRAIAAGADVSARGKQEKTPLMIAVDAQQLASVVALLKAGADPNAKAIDGHSPVSLATESYRAKPNGDNILAAVMHAGGDPNARRPDRDPVVMRFINDDDIDHLRRFKTLGADLDIRDRGDDPLITTVAMGQDWDMVWAMIELGGKTTTRADNPGARSAAHSAFPIPRPTHRSTPTSSRSGNS